MQAMDEIVKSAMHAATSATDEELVRQMQESVQRGTPQHPAGNRTARRQAEKMRRRGVLVSA